MKDQKKSVYTMETKVRYSACNANGQTRLSDILDYLQDTCTFQAEELGVGLEYMRTSQTAWVLNSWQADIERYPVFGEKIRISTWPYDFHGFFGFRNFKIEDESGNVMVRANSLWVFMDMQKNRPARITQKVAEAYDVQPKLKMEYMDRKIPDIETGAAKEAFRIPRYFIDSNDHVNNAKYILLAEEYLSPDFLPVRIRAEYKKQAVYGGLFYPFVLSQPDCMAVKLGDEHGNCYAMIEFHTKIPS